MSLVDNGSNNGMVMPVAPMNGGYGSSMGWGGDWSFWIIILFLFAFMGNGWGGFGAGNGAGPMILNNAANDVQRGFDQQSVMNGITGLTSAVSNGFANAEVSRCNAQANLLQTLNANQNAQTAAMNGLAMSLQNCCCENRAATADLKYTVATEACADRAAVGDALNSVLNTVNAQIQSVKDQMCQDKIDAKNERIQALENQLNMAQMRDAMNSNTSRMLADNAAQTQALEQYLNPAPIPAYMVQNPNCCAPSWNNCGCNNGLMA